MIFLILFQVGLVASKVHLTAPGEVTVIFDLV